MADWKREKAHAYIFVYISSIAPGYLIRKKLIGRNNNNSFHCSSSAPSTSDNLRPTILHRRQQIKELELVGSQRPWTKHFLEACIHELTSNGREDSGLKTSSWTVVTEKLKKYHNFVVDKKQMKNQYNYLKAKYAVWLKLKNKTGNLYNPVTDSFNMTNEEWEAEAKLNKYVDKLRNAPLSCPDLCIQLFDGATSTGVHSWGSSSTLPHPNEDFTTHDFEDIEMEEQAPHADTPNSTVPQPTSASPAREESSGRTKNKGGKRNGPKETTLDDELKEVGREIVKAAQAFTQANNLDKEMDDCMTKLASLEWGEFDPKYTTSLMLFAESAGNRKIWLRLNSSTCESWVTWITNMTFYIS
ncbi:uncharacterized protein LOC111876058 [Lactuca sativa]|uniref:uncharacterized protein LOC111876058 n=1 Tax=Lactuca sativa TaxID=4236 RepID=UPI000CD9AC3D|nr:uncharacterized protein LOC111876058 [Lactuca sativa]